MSRLESTKNSISCHKELYDLDMQKWKEGETGHHPVTLKQNANLMVTFFVRFS